MHTVGIHFSNGELYGPEIIAAWILRRTRLIVLTVLLQSCFSDVDTKSLLLLLLLLMMMTMMMMEFCDVIVYFRDSHTFCFVKP